MKIKGILAALFIICFFTFATIAGATNVRGRIVRGNNYPAIGVAVTVASPQAGRSYPAYTDYNGFYYLYNIPPGNYNLEIWVTRNTPLIQPIQVPSAPQFDLIQLTIP